MHSEAPLVSVIMPAYNVERYIERAINSMLNQTYYNIELLVADDGSTDRTKSIIDSIKDARIRRFHNEVNRGNLTTWNNLIANAKGEYITFQDADDWSDENRLSVLVKVLQQDADIKMISSDIFAVDKDGNVLSRETFPSSHEEIKQNLPDKFLFHCPAVMIRADMYKQYGGLNPYFDRIGAADWYWGAKIILNHKAITVNQPLYYYRNHSQSFTKRKVKNIRAYYSELVVKHLVAQQIATGTDDIGSGKFKQLRLFEAPHKIKHLLWHDRYRDAFAEAAGLILHRPFQPLSFYQNLFAYAKKYTRFKMKRILTKG